jgi:hypothetical protein
LIKIRYTDWKWNPDYSIFANEKFLKSQSPFFGFIGGFSGDELKFVLPYVLKKKLIFKFAVFQTGTIYLNTAATEDEEKEFLDQVVIFLRNEKIDFIAHPSSYVLFKNFPEKSIHAPFATYKIDLKLTEEELFSGMHQKHRNVIRNAEKNNVRIEHGKTFADKAFEVIVKTHDRSNMNFSGKAYFDNLLESLGENVEIFAAFKDDVFQGCAVIPFSRHEAFYLFGGSSGDMVLGAMNLMQWEIIKHFKSLGVESYNFVGARLKPSEGSKLEGIQRFKSRFGGEMKTGYLWKMPLNKIKFHLFNLIVKLRNFGSNSGKDIIDQEREKIEKK